MKKQMVYGFLDDNRIITDKENKIFYDYLDKINDTFIHFNIQPFYTKIVVWNGLTFSPHSDYIKKLNKNSNKELTVPELYDIIWEKFIDIRTDLGFDYVDAVRYLEKKKIIDTHSQTFSVVRITNNEIIAHKVIYFIEKMSKIFYNDIFFISYTGNALYCPVLVKNGMAKPYLEYIKGYVKEDLSIRLLRFLFSLVFFKVKTISKDQKKFFNALLSKKDYDWIPISEFERKFKIESLIGNVEKPYYYSDNLRDVLKHLDKEKNKYPRISMYDDVNYFPYEIIEKYGK